MKFIRIAARMLWLALRRGRGERRRPTEPPIRLAPF